MHGAISENEHFYLVASRDYDRKVNVFSTLREKFGAEINSNVEPGNFLVHDLMKEDHLLRILT